MKPKTSILFGFSSRCSSVISRHYICMAAVQCVVLGLEQSPETLTRGLTHSDWSSELWTQPWLSSAQQLLLRLIRSADSFCYRWFYKSDVSSLTIADLLCHTCVFVEQMLKHTALVLISESLIELHLCERVEESKSQICCGFCALLWSGS